jgi:hypothetical protein
MNRTFFVAILLFSSFGANAQNPSRLDFEKEFYPIKEEMKLLRSENIKLRNDINLLNSNRQTIIRLIDSLKNKIQDNTSAISNTANELGSQIKENNHRNEGEFTEVRESLSKKSVFGIIGLLLAIIISGVLFLLLSKKQKADKTDLIDQLSKAKSTIEESLVNEFGKQAELMESLIPIIQQNLANLQSTSFAEPDHSLALKVADEITLIERNINHMDPNIKGLKQLVRSVSKLKDNLSANGYELPELLGKKLNRGMHSIPVSTVPDENLEPGVEMITKIIKPQVNFKDKMIQAAQIEVSVGY